MATNKPTLAPYAQRIALEECLSLVSPDTIPVVYDLLHRLDAGEALPPEEFDPLFDIARHALSWNTHQVVRDETQRLRALPYADYLTTPHWDAVRTQALRNAAYLCQLCNSPNNLHVHHRSYQHRGEEQWFMADLVVLCDTCHAHHHGKSRQS